MKYSTPLTNYILTIYLSNMKHVVLGTIQVLKGADGIGRNRFVPHSLDYLYQGMRQFPVGAKMKVTYSLVKRQHSRPQHNYHFALCGLISEHTGFTADETHDALMKLAFGTKSVTLLGRTFEARESMSNTGGLSVSQVQELLQKDLEVCRDLDIHVPTMEQLGLISNH